MKPCPYCGETLIWHRDPNSEDEGWYSCGCEWGEWIDIEGWWDDRPIEDALQSRIDVLTTRLAAIHGAAQLNLDERGDYYKNCDCTACKRLRFILDESDLTPESPFTGELPQPVQDFLHALDGGHDDAD
jgi:hypothetical protein